MNYMQYSKKVTKWAMILITVVVLSCLAIVSFCGLPQNNVQAVVSLFATFSTVLGVTIGAYQGNSTLEKYSSAKYQFENLLPQNETSEPDVPEDEEASCNG